MKAGVTARCVPMVTGQAKRPGYPGAPAYTYGLTCTVLYTFSCSHGTDCPGSERCGADTRVGTTYLYPYAHLIRSWVGAGSMHARGAGPPGGKGRAACASAHCAKRQADKHMALGSARHIWACAHITGPPCQVGLVPCTSHLSQYGSPGLFIAASIASTTGATPSGVEPRIGGHSSPWESAAAGHAAVGIDLSASGGSRAAVTWAATRLGSTKCVCVRPA